MNSVSEFGFTTPPDDSRRKYLHIGPHPAHISSTTTTSHRLHYGSTAQQNQNLILRVSHSLMDGSLNNLHQSRKKDDGSQSSPGFEDVNQTTSSTDLGLLQLPYNDQQPAYNQAIQPCYPYGTNFNLEPPEDPQLSWLIQNENNHDRQAHYSHSDDNVLDDCDYSHPKRTKEIRGTPRTGVFKKLKIDPFCKSKKAKSYLGHQTYFLRYGKYYRGHTWKAVCKPIGVSHGTAQQHGNYAINATQDYYAPKMDEETRHEINKKLDECLGELLKDEKYRRYLLSLTKEMRAALLMDMNDPPE